MKTLIKVAAVLIVLIVLLVVGVVVLGLSQIDKIAQAAIERGGTYAMQVDTTVDSVDINLTAGTAELGGLNIANPPGFDTGHFMQLGDAHASVDLQSVRSDTILMPEITLSGIDVILDKGGNPSNYNTILNSLKRFESGDSAPPSDKAGGKKLVINRLLLEDINIHMANVPGISLAVGDVAVNIPEIELKDVGKEESMTTAEVINLVVKTVLAAAVEAGGGIIPADVLGELGNGLAGLESLSDMGIEAISELNLDEALGGVQEEINKAAEDVQGKIDDASKEVQDKIDEAANEIKNIFGGGNRNNDDP